MDLIFGWRTAVLSVTAAILLPLAGGLWRAFRNRVASRTLAACLLVMVGVFMPWLIGFAGFYDQWRWLTFAPFANALFVPPLLYLHGHALAHGVWPARGWRHLIPGAVQFGYQAACFLLPLAAKERWAEMSDGPGAIVAALLLTTSFLVYGRASLTLLRRYRAALATGRSDDALYAGDWLTRSMAAFALLAMVWAGCLLWDAAFPLGYFALMPLYVAIAGFALYLGIAGWRHLAISFPTLAELAVPPVHAAGRDWAGLGAEWARMTAERGWYREDGLTLHRLAARLGTNASYLSRALNEGLGVAFSDLINGLRCDEVAHRLREGSDRSLIDLAHEAGFASKASFNRCFRARFGVPPSSLRVR